VLLTFPPPMTRRPIWGICCHIKHPKGINRRFPQGVLRSGPDGFLPHGGADRRAMPTVAAAARDSVETPIPARGRDGRRKSPDLQPGAVLRSKEHKFPMSPRRLLIGSVELRRNDVFSKPPRAGATLRLSSRNTRLTPDLRWMITDSRAAVPTGRRAGTIACRGRCRGPLGWGGRGAEAGNRDRRGLP